MCFNNNKIIFLFRSFFIRSHHNHTGTVSFNSHASHSFIRYYKRTLFPVTLILFGQEKGHSFNALKWSLIFWNFFETNNSEFDAMAIPYLLGFIESVFIVFFISINKIYNIAIMPTVQEYIFLVIVQKIFHSSIFVCLFWSLCLVFCILNSILVLAKMIRPFLLKISKSK